MMCICGNSKCNLKEVQRLEWERWLKAEQQFWGLHPNQDVCRCHGDKTPEECIKIEQNEQFNVDFWNAKDKYRQIPLKLKIKMFRDSIPAQETKEMRKMYLQSRKEYLQTKIDEVIKRVEGYKLPEWLVSFCFEAAGFNELKKQLKKVAGELEYVFSDKKQSSITEEDIEIARTIDIVETGLLQNVRRTGQGRHSTKCLWHEEKSASMVIYPNGSFHCFGCQKSGSVIDVVMKVNGLTFIQAVKYLLGK